MGYGNAALHQWRPFVRGAWLQIQRMLADKEDPGHVRLHRLHRTCAAIYDLDLPLCLWRQTQLMIIHQLGS